MPKTPEELDRAENKFKLTLLQMEKRFVDLEMSISELKDKLKDINAESVTDLQQKINETEDLMFVEQAGITELKKVMEQIASKPGLPPEFEEKIKNLENLPIKFEEKINLLEKSVSDLVGRDELHERLGKIEKDIAVLAGKAVPTSVEMETIHERLGKIEKDISTGKGAPTPVELEAIHNSMGELQTNLVSLRNRTEGILRELYEKMKVLESRSPVLRPGFDFDLLSSKIAALRVNLDDISKRLSENSLKISEFDTRFEIVNNKIRESASEQFLDELKNNRKDLINTNVRVDSLERVARELMTSVQSTETSMKNFESIENITSLSKNVEEKLERFKFIEDEMRRLSSRIEMIYQNIDNELEKIRITEKKTTQISESVSELAGEVDRNRVDVLSGVRRDELDKLKSSFEERIAFLEGNYKKDVDSVLSLLRAQVSELKSPANIFDAQISELVNRLVSLESRLAAIERIIQEPSKVQPVVIE